MNNQKLAEALRALLPYAENEIASIAELVDDGELDECVEEEISSAQRMLVLAEEALREHDAQPSGYTVFLREADGTGTTHVSYHDGDRDEAVRSAMIECCNDWGGDYDLHVLDVAAGDVTIVEWDDQV